MSVGLTAGMMPGTMPAVQAVVARRAATADAIAEIIASGVRFVPGINAAIGSDKPHGLCPHTLPPFAESDMSNRDVLRSVPSEAANVVGRTGHRGVLRPGSAADLLVLGSSPIDAVCAVTDIRAVYRAGHRVR